MTHVCVGNLTIIASDNGLSPGRHQTIIQTKAGKLSIGHLGANFGDILIEIHTFSFKKGHLKTTGILSQPQYVNVRYGYINLSLFQADLIICVALYRGVGALMLLCLSQCLANL